MGMSRHESPTFVCDRIGSSEPISLMQARDSFLSGKRVMPHPSQWRHNAAASAPHPRATRLALCDPEDLVRSGGSFDNLPKFSCLFTALAESRDWLLDRALESQKTGLTINTDTGEGFSTCQWSLFTKYQVSECSCMKGLRFMYPFFNREYCPLVATDIHYYTRPYFFYRQSHVFKVYSVRATNTVKWYWN